MYNFQHVVNNYHLNSLWEISYRGIINSNKVIANAEKGVTDVLDHSIGEMHYLRAFFYYTLVNVWGRPYTQDPTQNLGVPLILEPEPDLDNLPPRATVAQVYQQIEKDLLDAAELMSNYQRPSSELRIFASEMSAYALLSRLYLYMDENEKAIEYADKVIDSNIFSLLEGDTYTKYPTYVPEDNSETIFACRALKDKDDYNWYAMGGMYARINGVGWGEMYASQPYRDLLGQYPQDLRTKFIEPQYVDPNPDGSTPMWIIFIEEKANPAGAKMFKNYDVTQNPSTQAWEYMKDGVATEVETEAVGDETRYFIYENGVKTYVSLEKKMKVRNGYPLYYVLKISNQEDQPQLYSPVISRLAEMYLNRAEAYAKLGDVDQALANINVIRTRAQIPPYTQVPAGKTILDLALEERRLELAYEAHRRYDVFRNGLTLDRRYPGTHDRGNALMTVPASHPRVVDFIPERQILSQPNLVQNP